jgi:hypothetical protein
MSQLSSCVHSTVISPQLSSPVYCLLSTCLVTTPLTSVLLHLTVALTFRKWNVPKHTFCNIFDFLKQAITVCIVWAQIYIQHAYYTRVFTHVRSVWLFFLSPPPCHHMFLMDFVVSPPGCDRSEVGRSMRRSYVVPMRWMVIYEYEGPWGALNLNSTKLPRPWSPWGSSPSRRSPYGRTGNRTRNLMISSQKLWPLDHEAGRIWQMYKLIFLCHKRLFRSAVQYRQMLLRCRWTVAN